MPPYRKAIVRKGDANRGLGGQTPVFLKARKIGPARKQQRVNPIKKHLS